MDNFTKELEEILELKHIVDAYKSYIEGRGKVPITELYLDNATKEIMDNIINEEKGFLIRNNDSNDNSKKKNIDVSDLFQIIEDFNDMGFTTDYIFSKDMSEMIIKVHKVSKSGDY